MGNSDYFVFTGVQGETLQAYLHFPHDSGDLKLELLDSAGLVEATANTSYAGSGGETITGPFAVTDTFYLRVSGDAYGDQSAYLLEFYPN